LRMRELAVQMENGIYTAKDRDNAQLEVNALLAEIDKIATNTRFNDVAVLDGSYDQTIRAGNTNPETIRVAVGSLKTADNAKVSRFAEEKAVGHANASVTVAGSGTYNDAADITEAFDDAITAGHYNLSDDGADGVDAAGTDTDLVARDGVDFKLDTSLFSSTFKEFFKADSLGTFSLAAVANGVHTNAYENDIQGNYDTDAEVQAQFKIDTKTGEVTLKDGVTWNWSAAATADKAGREAQAQANFWSFTVKYTKRDNTVHSEVINLSITQAVEKQLDDIKVETQADATRAVETLDKALEEISTAQAKLGAIQNRLSHNIDNLSKGSMLTEQSVGRIVDADFATETSELSKQQILAQAATSMLAQANQSKQSVLALLQ